jgi:hypothetical protein
MTPRSAAVALLLLLVARVGLTRAGSNEPLDFSYRVQGHSGIAALVFNDGSDIYIQPERSQLAELRVLDAQFIQEGPYLVVRGLRERFTLGWQGAVATVSYAPPAAAQTPRAAAVAPLPTAACKPSVGAVDTTYPVAFGVRSTQLSATFLEQLPAITADARTADAITVVGRPDVSDAQFAERRARKVRAALVTQGVAPNLIRVEARNRPEHGSELVISRRQVTQCSAEPAAGTSAAAPPQGTGALDGTRAAGNPPGADSGVKLAAAALGLKVDAPAATAVAAAGALDLAGNPQLSQPVSDEDRRKAIQQVIGLVQAGRISESIGAHLILAANSAQTSGAGMPQALMTGAVPPVLPPAERQTIATGGSTTLTFLPSSSVRRVLQAYLRERGIDLDWQVQGDLMVEEFAEIAGKDAKNVIETALRRLGLKGTLVAGRRLIVETRG